MVKHSLLGEVFASTSSANPPLDNSYDVSKKLLSDDLGLKNKRRLKDDY